MRFEGTLQSWNDDRGFGFITPTLGGQEIFVHVTAFATRSGRPQPGQRVSFEVELNPQGKKRARKVEPIRVARVRPQTPSSVQWGTATLFAIPVFLVLYLAAGVFWKAPAWIALVYLALSVFTFLAYWHDKTAATHGERRTPESTLHMLALAGGWPGALLAQQFLRHKSAKAEFRSVFWATAVLNVAAFLFACSPSGRALWLAQ